jgi:glycosyltransferase involved in cell wall biosynthesis
MHLSLSIIVPAYNVQEWIADCLDSIASIPRDDFEVIIVNDGSTDKTLEIAESYRSKFKHFTLLSQENQGASVGRNSGMKIAKGEYIFFCDSDDYIDAPEFNSFLQKTLESGVDISVGNGRDLIGAELQGPIKDCRSLTKHGVISGAKFYLIAENNGQFNISVCIRLYRASFLRGNNLFFIPGIIHEDEEFSPKALILAKSVIYYDHFFYVRRFRLGSVTKNTRHKYFNSKSCPCFMFVMQELKKFLGSRNWGHEESKAIRYVIHKCLVEILKREVYFAKEKLPELEFTRTHNQEIKSLLSGIKIDWRQRVEITRLKLKKKIYA